MGTALLESEDDRRGSEESERDDDAELSEPSEAYSSLPVGEVDPPAKFSCSFNSAEVGLDRS